MKIRTCELTDSALDWAVAKCEGHDVVVLTVDEQRQRWIDVQPSSQERTKAAADWDEHLAASARPKICVRGIDRYKRTPYHTEALMLFSQGVPRFHYGESWSQAGPIIEREKIHILPCPRGWAARAEGWPPHPYLEGPTPLAAAMRCFVASKMGDEVDVPDELLGLDAESADQLEEDHSDRPGARP